VRTTKPARSPILEAQRAAHVSLRLIADRLGELSLTSAEVNVLANLADGSPRTISALGVDVGSPPSTLTSVVDRLERRSYVERARSSDDRRAVIVALTALGREAADDVSRAVSDIDDQLLSGLSAATARGLRAGLRAMSEME
jgi:DNA-binding MarR family transcriptional regulator